MRTWLARLSAVAIGSVIALGVAVLVWRGRGDVPFVKMVNRSRELDALLASSSKNPSADIGNRRLPRRLLSPEAARCLFPAGAKDLVYEPLPYFRRKAFRNQVTKWEEHPDGHFTMRTNSLGMRMDCEVRSERPDLRLLVVGDSHTEGVCNNSENLTQIAATRLEELLPGKSVEALNAATGGYSFYNYLGQLERLRDLDPDFAVVVVYAGNDFYENLAPWHFFRGEKAPRTSREGARHVQAVTEYWPAALSQAFVSLRFFHEHPDELAVALQAALAAMGEIRDFCARERMRLVCVYLPAVSDVQPWLEPELRRRAMEELELDDEEVGAVDRLGTSFLDDIRAGGIRVLDMRPIFRAAKEPMYWLRDHHISVAGHREVGRALAEFVAQMRR